MGPKRLAARQFYALVWKDFVIHKRHYVWTALEVVIPVLVCAMAIVSNSHAGKAKLENERTFEQDDYERIYGELSPSRHRLLVAPNSSFTRALVEAIDDGAVRVELVESERRLVELIRREIPVSLDQVKRLLPDDSANVTIGGAVIESDFQLRNSSGPPGGYFAATSRLDGSLMHIPVELRMSIRAQTFRLGPEPFPKKYSLGPFSHSDHYSSTFFMASQIMLSRAYMNLLASHLRPPNASALVPTNDDIVGQRMPYPKFVAHKRLKESTLGTFVAGSQKQKPFVLTMDYCVQVGFLVTAIFLAKRVVDERKSRVRDMLRLVGISDWIYYGSHAYNTLAVMGGQCLLIALLFTGHAEAPAQHVQTSLLFALLLAYALASVLFVLFLASLFSSSTRAIVATSLLWLGAPEVLERVFRLQAGVIESSGFLDAPEVAHLALALVPNFGLRLTNRLLTECDIYGEFYAKKQLYRQYTATWANANNVLPLYKSLTLLRLLGAFLLAAPLYCFLIYLANARRNSSAGLAGLGAARAEAGAGRTPVRALWSLVSMLVLSPFKLAGKLAAALAALAGRGPKSAHKHQHQPQAGYLNQAFAGPHQAGLELSSSSKQQQQQQQPLPNQHQHQHQHQHEDSKYFEQAPKMLRVGVQIRNLSKTYITSSSSLRQIHAVRDVSLDMYYSQILVLLGHNGAGKTTLIDIISGHNSKSAGRVAIDGHDIDLRPREARRQLGFCPQFDVLFERLTVDEHLYFYGLVKGSSTGELRSEIELLLQQSGLDVHRRKLAKNLSGGYKRKLSLAIAMCAQSKVLILDEPTSGMDPESRRNVWDFLQLIRQDRLILMTTHHMEEADALGDRVAIMSAGQVRCCGSALFLKRAFDAGYHLRVSKSAHAWNQRLFDQLVGARFQLAAKLDNVTPHELVYTFQASDTASVLAPLTEQLEKVRDQVGIFGFGITVSTMDDVFMRVSAHFEPEPPAGSGPCALQQQQQQRQQQGGCDSALAGASSAEARGSLGTSQRLTGSQLARHQLRALLAKRCQHARRNWFQLVWILSVSLACVAGIVLLIELVIFKEELTPEWSRELSLAGAGYGLHTHPVYQIAPESQAGQLERLREAAFPTGSTTTAPTTTTASININTTAARDKEVAFMHQVWLAEARAQGALGAPLEYADINTQMIDLLTSEFADFRERYVIGGERAGPKYVAWYNGEASHSFPIAMNVMLNSILKQQVTDLIQDDAHPLKGSRISLTHRALAQINTLVAFLPHLGRLINLVFLPFSLAFITSYFVIFPTHERVSKSKHLQLMTGVSSRTFWLAHFLFDLCLYAAYTVLVLAIYFIWDRVLNEHRIYFANLEHSAALVALVVVFIFSALPQAYMFSFVAKKATSAFSSFCVLTILTGTATLTLVSLYELKYEQSASAGLQLAFGLFLCAARLIPSVSLLVGLQKLFALNTTRSICINISPEVLDLLCRYINSPLVDDELRVLKPERCCKQVCANECFDQSPLRWSGWFGVNQELAMLAFDALLYWACLVLVESPRLRRAAKAHLARLARAPAALGAGLAGRKRRFVWQLPRVEPAAAPAKQLQHGLAAKLAEPAHQATSARQAVQQEARRAAQVLGRAGQAEHALVVDTLTKRYSRSSALNAVDGLSFVVDKREFFGLLGVNGAGKSSTFKMLTGELAPTSGRSYAAHFELGAQARAYLQQVGYCPQQDALLGHLSGRETLALYARLRGVPERQVAGLVEATLHRLGLSRIGTVQCASYSGGNKRRLSVGVALIGAPSLVLLDEPTNGVDPRSRRRMWRALIEFQRAHSSAIVMTSHSMNECECLCDRVAIMVDGQFKVLGSVQQLRTQLSQGFSLVLKLKAHKLNKQRDLAESSSLVHDYMRQAFAGTRIELRDAHQTTIQYHVDPAASLSWSAMLAALERAKLELDLEDYQVSSDASLESIFLSLAKQQRRYDSGPAPSEGAAGGGPPPLAPSA